MKKRIIDGRIILEQSLSDKQKKSLFISCEYAYIDPEHGLVYMCTYVKKDADNFCGIDIICPRCIIMSLAQSPLYFMGYPTILESFDDFKRKMKELEKEYWEKEHGFKNVEV